MNLPPLAQSTLSLQFQSGIRDNHLFGKVSDFLKEKIKPHAQLRFVSAYFSIFGFEILKEELLSIDKLQFLFGEPTFVKQLDLDPSQAKAFNIVEQDLALSIKRLEQKSIAKICANWISDKVEIRSLTRSNLLHGKLYHIHNHDGEAALLGSSNFTLHGLGGNDDANIELNLVVDSDRDRQSLKYWFDTIWKNSELVKDVKQEVLHYLKQLYFDHSPQFIYYKTLYHVFYQDWQRYQEQREAIENSPLHESQIWNTLFDFQKEGVTHAITKIQAYNGCILADSVGLGKTYEALAVIKYFEAKNQNVLVLCPKKLSQNWLLYSANYNSPQNPLKKDRLRYTVLSHTDLSRDQGESNGHQLGDFDWGNFDLIVIDESHNFRNDNKGKKTRSRYERLLEDVLKKGGNTKVLLLSATPVNNNLSDLYNQIRLINADNNQAFAHIGITDTKKTLTTAQNAFQKAVKEKRHAQLADTLHSDFFKLLDALTIARSRKHIERHYPDVAQQLGGFPTREKPQSLYYEIDTQAEFPTFVEIEQQINAYQLSLFRPSQYLKPEFEKLPQYQSKVKNFTQADREHYLIGMMKINFLKRLESSVASFTETMKRTVTKIDELIEKIKQHNKTEVVFDNPFDFDDPFDDEEELNDTSPVDKKNIFELKHLDCQRWLEDLEQDKKQLIKLRDISQKVTPARDGKLKVLKQLLAQKIDQPTINKQGQAVRKVLIFTAFADTAQYLYDTLKNDLNVYCGLVTGSKSEATLGRPDFNEVLLNFSPISKKRSDFRTSIDKEIDVLIATDCISEGQNLQDCDWVINYDIHWNPVRLIQRFGRIDRINSQNKTVSMINFWATPELDQYLNLKNRVEARMALVDIAGTGADNLLTENEEMTKDALNYRDEQLKRMKDEILDLEDLNDGTSLTDFNLDDFRADLGGYLDLQRHELEKAPKGLYALVPAKPEKQIYPGVIFCLQQKEYQRELEQQVNPLTPFFLVYIQDNGTVKYNFAEAKSTLEIFKNLCIHQTEPYSALCQLFDEQTHNGQEMKGYYALIEKAVEAIANTVKQKEITNLKCRRDWKIPKITQQITKPTDFTLVTWLIIQ